jgi:hypothetical protein
MEVSCTTSIEVAEHEKQPSLQQNLHQGCHITENWFIIEFIMKV